MGDNFMRPVRSSRGKGYLVVSFIVAAVAGACFESNDAKMADEDVEFRDCTSGASCPGGVDQRCTGYTGCKGTDGVGCQSWIATAWNSAGVPTDGYILSKCCGGGSNCSP